LNDVYQYCMEWTVKINRTKVIVFGTNKRGIRNFNFTIAGNNIEIVDSYKYIGVYFSSNGSFYKARSHLVSQARKAMYLLYKQQPTFNNDLQLKLVDHTISPILSYGSKLWSYENTDIIEKVHLECLRKITKVKRAPLPI